MFDTIDHYTLLSHPHQCFDIKYFYIWYLQSKPCSTLFGWSPLDHSPRAYTHRGFDSHLPLGRVWGGLLNSVCVHVRACACARGVKSGAERVEKAHIKPAKVYLKSQALFGLKRNNKQMYTWTRTIIRGASPGPRCAASPECREAEGKQKTLKDKQIDGFLSLLMKPWSHSQRLHEARMDERRCSIFAFNYYEEEEEKRTLMFPRWRKVYNDSSKRQTCKWLNLHLHTEKFKS